MKISIVEDYDQLSEKAAAIVAGQLQAKKDSVLGLATGSTPEGMYANLVKMYREGLLDFSSVITFNLDEYVGLSPQHPQSYQAYMYRLFFDHVNIKPENIYIPSLNENMDSVVQVCRDYDQKIYQAGGIDLQILGIGVNGHIGFNESGSSLPKNTYMVDLSPETIEANSRFFDSAEEVPHRAVTMGLGPIMHAKRVLLLASGRDKAEAVKESFSGHITTQVPASLLQLHPAALVLVDHEAAFLLNE
ncbi:MAG: glucosamine-6-phosphate deaminase [Bacillota bacterium]